MTIDVQPVTKERWEDLEVLFGERGAYANCWCLFWRLERAQFKKLNGEGRKAVLREMTLSDQEPGLLAYLDGKPVGWCSVGPREDYRALERSRLLKRLDQQPTWSIVCFYIDKAYRKQGIMKALIRGAVEYAESHAAQIVEAYPIDLQAPKLEGQKLSGCGGYMGIAEAFRKAGFVEAGRASETQPIMRYFFNQA